MARKVCGGSDQDLGREVCVDTNDNVYITGSFKKNNLFGETVSLSSSPFSSHNAFLVKFSFNGNFQWVRSVSTTSFGSIGHGIAYSKNSNTIFLSGLFGGTATLGTEQVSSQGTSNVFTANYDTSGTCNWAVQAGGSSLSASYGMDIDSLDNSYVVGYFTGTADFDLNNITSAGNSDLFIAKLDTSNSTVSIIENQNSSEFQSTIYPNPTNGMLTIILKNNSGEANYVITTIDGKMVKTGRITNNFITIDLTSENNGIYFLMINDNGSIATYKINKQ